MQEIITMPASARLVTVAELERMPEAEGKRELVAGRVVEMSPVGCRHGDAVLGLGSLLRRHVQRHNLGRVFTEVGFTLRLDPDTVRAPDVAFVRRDRLPTPLPRGYWQGPPDLAVEVRSPNDRPRDIAVKIDEYLGCGVRIALVVDPDRRLVTLHRPGAPALKLTSRDTLDLSDIVAGFHLTVSEIFE